MIGLRNGSGKSTSLRINLDYLAESTTPPAVDTGFDYWCSPSAGARVNLGVSVPTETASTSFVYDQPVISTLRSNNLSNRNFQVPSPLARWSPYYLSNLFAWYDTSDPTFVSTDILLPLQWLDLSGNNRHAISPATGFNPTYTTGQYLTFDGVDNGDILVVTPNTGLPNQHSVFYVATQTGQTSIGSFLRPVVAGKGSVLASYGCARSSNLIIDYVVGDGGGDRIPVVANSWAVNETVIVSATYNGSLVTGRKNGASYGTYSVTTSGFGRIEIGGESSVSSRRFAGRVSEIVICNASLSLSDVEKVEGYLAHKWSLSSLLSVGHPYKNAPPVP